jgi:type I restriction enzyme S subunit
MAEFLLDKTSWVPAQLKDLAEEISERVDNPSKSGHDRFVGLDNFVSGDLKIKNWSDTENLVSSAKAFKAEDILFARRNAYLRRASLVDFDGICSGDAFVLRENHKHIIPGFLTFILNSNKLWDFANANAAGTMSKRVKWRDLGNFQLLLPPKDQQVKLAELLWAGDKVLSTYDNMLASLESLKITFLSSQINPTVSKENLQYSPLGYISKDWRLVPIEDLAEVNYGISEAVASNKDPRIGCPIITGSNITLEGALSTQNIVYYPLPEKAEFRLQHGDLLFNWRSGSPAHVGKTAYFDLNGDYTFASFLLRIRTKEELLPRFGFYLLNYLRKTGYFMTEMSQQINFKMNANIFRQLVIPIPSVEQQRIITKKLEQISDIHEHYQQIKSTFQKIQSLVINKIFD